MATCKCATAAATRASIHSGRRARGEQLASAASATSASLASANETSKLAIAITTYSYVQYARCPPLNEATWTFALNARFIIRPVSQRSSYAPLSTLLRLVIIFTTLFFKEIPNAI